MREYWVMKPGWIVAHDLVPRTARPYIPSVFSLRVADNSTSSSRVSDGFTPSLSKTSERYAIALVSKPHGKAHCPPVPRGSPTLKLHESAARRLGNTSSQS